jgi:methionyl-tRNA synthetase
MRREAYVKKGGTATISPLMWRRVFYLQKKRRMDMKKTFYITTPIYYPSDKLHIGHSYTTVAADAMARFKRLTGYDVKFLTGTDEHGQKIQRIAREKGMSPKEYVDGIVEWIKDLWKIMDMKKEIYTRANMKDGTVLLVNLSGLRASL